MTWQLYNKMPASPTAWLARLSTRPIEPDNQRVLSSPRVKITHKVASDLSALSLAKSR